jgi:hypothetical protein
MLGDINDAGEDRVCETVYDAGPRSEEIEELNERRSVVEI